MKKVAIVMVAIFALSMFVASVSVADVPAPPVNQTIGFDDKVFNDFDEATCNICHGDGTVNADRHHLLYGGSIPQGVCSATDDPAPRDCYTDADCVTATLICSNSGDPCTVDADCPRQYQHPVCTTTPYCAGTSAAANVPGSASNGGVYGCLTCHEQDTTGGTTNFVVERDCMVCHVQLPNSPSVHHLDEDQNLAKAGICTACHGDIVDDKDDGHAIPTYSPSLVTPGSVTTVRNCTETGWGPAVECTSDADCAGVSATSVCDEELHKAAVAEPGSCDYCHAPGTDAASGVNVVDNHDTHHGTGVYKDRYGNTVDLGTGNSREICGWCHYLGYPHSPGALDPIEIRTCENCHGMESLHNIQADSDASGTIVIGGELAGYGHVGRDNPADPTNDSDCWGCHGFGMASASAPGADIVAPTIDAISPSAIAAGVDTVITVTGSGFTNDGYTSVLELTPVIGGGNTITVTPLTVSVDTITASVNLPVNGYKVVADKNGVESGDVVLVAAPAAIIELVDIEVVCGDCTGKATITGSGFGEAPAGSDAYINVKQGDITLSIVSWTDTEIVVEGVACDGAPITVNAYTGSATQ